MILNYVYRIYPNGEQTQLLNEWLETCRLSYNYALRELKDWIASRKCQIDRCSLESEYIMAADYPFPSYHQQQNNLPKAKKVAQGLKAVPSQVLQTNIRRLHDAWDFFRNRGYGFPRYKKYGQMKSLLFPQFKTNPLTDFHISLPKLKKVPINLHRPIPEGFVVKQVRVVRKAVGWFAVIAIESDISIPDPVPHAHCIGLDVGLLSYCSTSDGFVEPGRKFFKSLHPCPNCRITVRKDLSDRLHSCPECLYEVDRDIAAAQELCNRGIETYRGTPEKKEIGSQEGLRGECIRPFKRPVVVLSGNLVLDKWRRGAMPNREFGKPPLYSLN